MKRTYNSLDDNNKLIWNFRDIGHTMRHISEGKGGQKRILVVLSEYGTMTQRELTRHLGIQSGSASEVIGKLEVAGLIQRMESESDRRTTDIILTEEGKEEAKKVKAERELRHQEMFACLSADEKKTLVSLLEKVNIAWEQQYHGKKMHCRNHGKR